MTTRANFKIMFQAIGWDVNNAVELVYVHGINSMVQLSRVDEKRIESRWNHGLTIILVSSLSSRIMGLAYDYAVE